MKTLKERDEEFTKELERLRKILAVLQPSDILEAGKFVGKVGSAS